MVYGGRPSRGCETCKKRKIKCDEKRPTCLQCKKSSRTCLGYPDEADLIFRNQNDKIAGRSQKSKKPKDRPLPAPDSTQSESGKTALQLRRKHDRAVLPSSAGYRFEDVPQEGATFSLHPPPTVPMEEQVVQVYFKNFRALYYNEDTIQGFLPYLVPMYQTSKRNSALRIATRATALCAISQLPAQRHLTYHATAMYTRAIIAVSSALQDPAEARSDETLQATLLLCLYESIRASDNTITAWSNHVDGATALVRARGSSQFANTQSLSLFRAARTQMLTNCIRQEIPPPPFPGERGWLGDGVYTGELQDLTQCAIDLSHLLSQAKDLLKQERSPPTMRTMSNFIEIAYALTVRMTKIVPSLPDSWQPRTIAYINTEPEDPGSAEAWVGPVHAYTDVYIASVLNKLRSVCMFSTWIVMDCIAWLFPDSHELDGRWQHSKHVEQTMIDDMCSSVPFVLRWRSEATAKSLDQMETIADLIGGLSLVWPLGGAVFSPRIDPGQKAWIWGRLRKISQEGLEQASLLETDVKRTLDSFLNRPLY
ncbi:hypothetical protein AAFC00_001262 [Neodothiora populina]|uniref:Zn(2)-C6 fungal-type domain-containing protein n=1 Tax=Neodothiora populina TaxID=2781224 RepID=A0ABR3PNK8_9PEZI